MRLRSLIALSLVAGFSGWLGAARAGEPGRPAPTKEQAAVAGKKFREGELYFAKHDYPRAAKLFEEAYSIAPHPDALLNAIDARERAGELLTAARLCERLRKDYASDKNANEEVAERIARLTPKLGRLEIVVHPGVTGVKVDSEVIGVAPAQAGALPTATWWVDPGDHGVSATTTKGPLTRSVNVVAGAKQSVVLEEQAAPPVEPVKPPPPPPDDGKPLHPAVFFVGLGLTAGAGGVLAWSGVDTLGAYDDYESSPTQTGLDDGRTRQLRTNVLIGVTAGLGVATAAIGIFATEWSVLGGSETAMRLDVGPSFASLSGSFR